MDTLVRYLRLFGVFARTELQFAFAYRANLAIESLQTAVVVGTSVAAVLVMFSYTDALNGWSLSQMLVLLGVFYLVQGSQEFVFAPSFQKFMEHVRLGTLDFTLLKPVNSQFMVSVRHLEITQAAQVLLGLVVMGIGLTRLAEAVTLGQALAFVVALTCGTLLVYALLLVLATTSFWFVRTDNIFAIFWAFLDAGRFPVDVYPGWLRFTMTTVVPVGVAITVPAQAIAGRLEPVSLVLLVAGTVVGWLFASWFWRFGLRNYTGASA